MDKFKQYLQENSSKLDLEEPGERVWKNIRKQKVEAKPVITMFAVLRYAAAACILVLAGIGIWHLTGHQSNTPVAIVKEIKDSLKSNKTTTLDKDSVTAPQNIASANVDDQMKVNNSIPADKLKTTESNTHKANKEKNNKTPEMGELRYVENNFMQVINIERQKINSSPLYAESPAYFNDFKNRMMQMDNDEKLLRSDIRKHGPDSELIDQLINIYQQKLNLLKQLQTEMNKMNSRYKQNKPASDSLATYFLNI